MWRDTYFPVVPLSLMSKLGMEISRWRPECFDTWFWGRRVQLWWALKWMANTNPSCTRPTAMRDRIRSPAGWKSMLRSCTECYVSVGPYVPADHCTLHVSWKLQLSVFKVKVLLCVWGRLLFAPLVLLVSIECSNLSDNASLGLHRVFKKYGMTTRKWFSIHAGDELSCFVRIILTEFSCISSPQISRYWTLLITVADLRETQEQEAEGWRFSAFLPLWCRGELIYERVSSI